MKPQQRVIIYRHGLKSKPKYAKTFEASQERYAQDDDYRACSNCDRYVKIAKSGRLFQHRMGVGINNIMCLNPLT